MISDMVKRTGLRDQLQLDGAAPKDISGYLHLSLTVEIPEATTMQLMSMVTSGQFDQAQINQSVQDYFDKLGDPEHLCASDADSDDVSGCEDRYQSESEAGIAQMHRSLVEMAAANQSGDQKAFAKAYARFGEALLKNEFTFAALISLSQGSPLNITFEAEGAKISKVSQTIADPGARSSLAAAR
jgi:hypothetical protein